MADGDDQFTRGVQDGYDDAPLYQWQDPFYQERYETGYTLGHWQRVTQALSASCDEAVRREAMRRHVRNFWWKRD